MIFKHHLSSQLFDNHLTYGETKPDTILVDIILEIQLCEHFSNYIGVLKTYAFIAYNYLKRGCWYNWYVLDINRLVNVLLDKSSCNVDFSLIRVFYRILYQICENLLKPAFVKIYLSLISKVFSNWRTQDVDMKSFLNSLVPKDVLHME